ncbi:hypothetical protein EVAR_84820_1 [Eumeta japonica]|uniref:Uncharacterized protein n=1 Tax=Eumeta variegata TaxID=151549 RepID=A0A4C1U904_EUMVA|nr:hypothetical protein EVAR_84820_1 [Eumeta japonica]
MVRVGFDEEGRELMERGCKRRLHLAPVQLVPFSGAGGGRLLSDILVSFSKGSGLAGIQLTPCSNSCRAPFIRRGGEVVHHRVA